MGYYMRFISIDKEDISLNVLESALRQSDADYRIKRDNESDNEGIITNKEEIYGQIYVYRPGDGIFDSEVEVLKDFVEEAGDQMKQKQTVLSVLNHSTMIIFVRVLWQGRRESEETLEKLDPLWDWLLAKRKGLIQADNEGYYDATGLILEVD